MTSSLSLNIYIIFLFNIAIIFHTLEGFELYSKWFEFFVRSISSMKWIRYLCLLIWVSNKIMKKSFSNYQYFHRSFSFFLHFETRIRPMYPFWRVVWGSVHLYPKNPIIVESYPFLFLLQGISSSSLEQRCFGARKIVSINRNVTTNTSHLYVGKIGYCFANVWHKFHILRKKWTEL